MSTPPPRNWDFHHDVLRNIGVTIAPGLTPEESADIELRCGFRFPLDLREFLQHGLPVSHEFVNWRNGPWEPIHQALAAPADGICFDIEHNGYWIEAWGERPRRLIDAFEVARARVREAPRLIPIRGHRYLPDRPTDAGNPVLSVSQTDIIYYGANLEDYLANEFPAAFGRPAYRIEGELRKIELWSSIVEGR